MTAPMTTATATMTETARTMTAIVVNDCIEQPATAMMTTTTTTMHNNNCCNCNNCKNLGKNEQKKVTLIIVLSLVPFA